MKTVLVSQKTNTVAKNVITNISRYCYIYFLIFWTTLLNCLFLPMAIILSTCYASLLYIFIDKTCQNSILIRECIIKRKTFTSCQVTKVTIIHVLYIMESIPENIPNKAIIKYGDVLGNLTNIINSITIVITSDIFVYIILAPNVHLDICK